VIAWIRVLEALYAMAAALSLLSLIYAVGHAVLRKVLPLPASNIDRLLYSIAIGTGVVGTGVLSLGALSLLHAWVLLPVFFLVALLVRREYAGMRELLRIDLRRPARFDPLALLVASTAVVVAVLLLANALPPQSDWDSLAYHLALPQDYVDAGRIYLSPASAHVAFIGLAHMLYVPLLAAGAPAGPAVLSALYALLLSAAIWRAGERLFDLATAQLAFIAFWGTTSVLFVAVTPRVDVFLAFVVFAALYVLIASDGAKRNIRELLLAAGLLGFAGAIKYHGFLFGIAVAPLILHRIATLDRSVQSRLLVGCGCIALGSLAASPLLVKNQVLLGAPLYPYGTEPVLPPWLAAIAGSKAVPASVSPEIFDLLATTREPFNLPDLFLAPSRISAELEAAYYFTNPLLLLLPLGLLAMRNRAVRELMIPATLYLLVVLVPHPRSNLRYLIPAVAPMTLVTAHLIVRASGAVSGRGAKQWFRAGIVALSLPGLLLGAAALLVLRAPVVHFDPGRSVNDYLAKVSPGHEVVRRLLDDHVPAGDTTLLLFEARRSHLRNAVLEDGSLLNWPLMRSVLADGECLPAHRIQYVLVNRAMVGYFAARGLDTDAVQWHAFGDFAARCLSQVAEDAGIVLFRPRPQEVSHLGT
jgi:hypothetical protein